MKSVRLPFGIILFGLAVALFICSLKALKSPKALGKPVSGMIGSLIPPVIGNMIIILSSNHLLSTFGCYAYYIGMDFVMLALIRFTAAYCHLPWKSYARQLAYEDSSITEKLTRQFNYPDNSIIKSAKDIESMQIKAFFCSNVCCAYNMHIFNELGGFVDHTIFNEDMIYAAGALRAGYRIAYCAEACVYHSHEYSGCEQLRRNFDNGVSHAQYPDVFEGVGQDAEGKRMVKNVLSKLLRSGHLFKSIGYVYSCGCKYIGFKLGCRYEKLPMWLVKAFSSQKEYFD